MYLTGLWTGRVKMNLFCCKFSACVHIIAQINPSKSTLAQQLPPTPRHWSCRSCTWRIWWCNNDKRIQSIDNFTQIHTS